MAMSRYIYAMLVLTAVSFAAPGNIQQQSSTVATKNTQQESSTRAPAGNTQQMSSTAATGNTQQGLSTVAPEDTQQELSTAAPVNTQHQLITVAQQELSNMTIVRSLFSLPVQEAVPPQQPPVSLSVRLNTACLKDKECVFQISGINYTVLESVFAIKSDVPCSKEDCISDNQTCLCCDKRVNYLQGILQEYSEADFKYQKLVADRAMDTDIQEAMIKLQELRLKLLEVCSEVYCINTATRTCELIKCMPGCEQTTTTTSSTTLLTTTIRPPPPTTTTRPTTATTTRQTTTTTTRPTTTTTTRPTTTTTSTSPTTATATPPAVTASKTRTSYSTTANAFADQQDSPNVAAVVLGVVLSLLVAVGVAVFLIFWWRRRRAMKEGTSHGSPSTVAITMAKTGESQHAELSNDADNYAVISDVTNDRNYVNSMTAGHQSEIPRKLCATDSLGYEEVVTPNLQTEYPKNFRPESSDAFYSPLSVSDRERSKTDEQQEYTPLELYQNSQNKTQVCESRGGYTSLTHPASRAVDSRNRNKSSNEYLELI